MVFKTKQNKQPPLQKKKPREFFGERRNSKYVERLFKAQDYRHCLRLVVKLEHTVKSL